MWCSVHTVGSNKHLIDVLQMAHVIVEVLSSDPAEQILKQQCTVGESELN